jgi:predicted DsbA family dithiol-disulfide isomerase
VPVDIWTDIACPWCYLGKRRWQAALAGFPDADRILVRWRAFELRPGEHTVGPQAIRADRVLAAEVGVTAVPSYRIGRRNAVSGALDADQLLALLDARAPA